MGCKGNFKLFEAASVLQLTGSKCDRTTRFRLEGACDALGTAKSAEFDRPRVRGRRKRRREACEILIGETAGGAASSSP
eukprot:6190006-Pleurochrysis_carterae.AAC.1